MKYIFLFVASVSALKSTGQWRKFGEFTAHAVDKQVNLFHLRDMDGDQLPDIVSFYSAADTEFSMLKGKPGGGFSTAKTFDKPVNYHLSDIADLNNDGYNEIVIASYWNNGFRVFWGTAAGDYSQSDYFGIGGHGKNIKCVDINKDGKIDILFTSSGSGQAIILYVYINKGDGRFEPARSYPSLLDTSKDIMITDKNNDGLLDIVVSSSFPWLLFYFQKPDGSFEAQYLETTITAYTVFKDFDQDNKDDMIMLYPSFENTPDSDSLLIFRSLEGDKFASSVRVPAFENKKIRPGIMLVADINKDGEQDIILNHLDINYDYTDTAFYLLGKGNLVFDDPMRVIMPGKVVKMQLVDLNADGYPDWIVSCTNNTIAVSLNNKATDNMPQGDGRVYPNPSTGLVIVDQLNKEPYTVKVYNTAGALIEQLNITGPSASIDLAHMQSGLYFLEMRSHKQKLVKKWVKL